MNFQKLMSPNFFVWILFLMLIMGSDVSANDKIDYQKTIKPLLAERCFACHGGLKQESSLRLDSGKNILKGGDSGVIIVPGKADESELIAIVSGEGGSTMPPEGLGTALKEEEIELLKKWINQGAHFPENDQPQADPRNFWSYQPVKQPKIPQVKNKSWIKNPVDSFISAKHEELKLTPAQPALPEKILRRLYLDLIGLPPTRSQLEAFLKDPSEEAYEKVVDNLLNSPQYGERWGRHWMDIWRYSDWYGSTAANEIRNSQYHIWHWRDWIVESLNQDKGYDSMIHEMLAADELAPEDSDKIRATGYLARNWYLFNRTTWLIDTIEHTNMAFLGVTMKCARCHDHKFDPIPQTDYYSFRAIFEPHAVRLDRIPEEMDIKKDGLPRVFDDNVKVKTYLFERGDERTPDKDNPISAGVPAILGNLPYEAKQISLPLEAYYQEMRPHFINEKMESIRERLKKMEAELDLAKKEKILIDQKVASVKLKTASWREDVMRDAPGKNILDFSSFSKMADHWTEENGKWALKDDQLETGVPASGKSIRLITKQNHPENFYARLVYRPLQPGNYRSIGFSYDYLKPRESQDIYTSTGDKEQSVQAFHRVNGKDVYPYSGVVKTKLKVNELTTVEIVARGRDLRIWLNGKMVLDYVMPVSRRAGKFAIWVFSGTAKFQDFELRSLDETSEDIKRKLSESTLALAIKEKDYEIIQSELVAFPARVKAEKAKHQIPDKNKIQKLKREALIAEKQADFLKKKKEFMVSDHFNDLVNNMDPNAVQGVKPLKDDAKKIQESALSALEKMKKTLEAPEGELKPIGTPHSSVSTGRRLALARWMTNPNHPRTARIAVNHIWLRHFGKGIVPTVADFGIRSQPRTHPELLDWLSAELMKNNWKMKPLHKLLVMSNTYRLSTASGNLESSKKNDPGNKYFWRMNSRRMEAEVIRDSLLFATNQLDLKTGGPDYPSEMKNDNSKTPYRRSLYYKTTPDIRMSFLDQFDVANPLQCYARRVSVVPQQALAMTNSRLSQNSARKLCLDLKEMSNDDFIKDIYIRFLTRIPSEKEMKLCNDFLTRHKKLLSDTKNLTKMLPGKIKTVPPSTDPATRARENLIQVLFNHNDFVTIR